MSPETAALQLPPVSAAIDNPDAWDAIAQQVSAGTGAPIALTSEQLTAMVGSAVPLLFEADRAGNANLLRGTFADTVIAQRQRNFGDMRAASPQSVSVHLVGVHTDAGHAVLRAHLRIEGKLPDGTAEAFGQFWDIQLGAQVMVGAHSCPNCGAPLETGELVCHYCHTDVRSLVQVPLVVNRMELY